MDSDGGLRHLAFFEELGRMDDSDASWRAVSAGLVTMRLVDRWIAVGSTSRLDSWSVSAAREAIAQVSDATPIRRILTSVVDVMVACTVTDMHALSPRLMALWPGAGVRSEVGAGVGCLYDDRAYTHPADDSDLAIAASLQLGFCLRTTGRLDAAAVAYAQASEMAGAVERLLRHDSRKDGRREDRRRAWQHAERRIILMKRSSRPALYGLDDVRSRALNDRAFVAGQRGQHDRVIRFSYDALSLSKSQRERDRILTNIATAFRYIGLLDVARDAHLLLASTAQEQFIRWNSALNLLDLAAQQGSELQFDRYRRELEVADLTPQLRATYLLYVGRGYGCSISTPSEFHTWKRRSHSQASSRLNQLMFEAESALADARQAKRTVARTEWVADTSEHR